MIEPIRRQKRSGLQVQLAVIHALILREMVTRFGHYRLGYLWAVIEPGANILIMVLVFGFLVERTMPSISYPLFLVNGIIPWMMFANIVTRSIGAIDANKGLFNYRYVLPIDAIFARCILEFVLSVGVYIVFMFGLAWFAKEVIHYGHLLMLALCWMLLLLFSFGFSLLMMVVGHHYAELAKIVRILFQILYFASGILYSLNVIPSQYLKYILWNPVPHVLELMRNAVHPAYPIDHVSLFYLVVSTLVVLTLGLLVYKANERAMLTTS